MILLNPRPFLTAHRVGPDTRTRLLRTVRFACVAAVISAPLLFSAAPPVEGVAVQSADGETVRLLATEDRAVVLVFMAPDCPISNRYLPKLKEIAASCARHAIDFWLVYPDAAVGSEQVRKHREEYGHTLPALLDPEHTLVRLAEATVTPEAAVLLPPAGDRGVLRIYRGRIDDTWQDYGVNLPAPTTEDLKEVTNALATGRIPASRTTRAVGCYITR